ncbi:MAG: SDR family oxidoreductase [Calditrichaeota bacterium]|nr:SDR family oxidoreductase [Calditrichota bacterium]MBT7616880.1 SDR family oxidoreductase [Calditrichota bacterium]MBT7788595.1 SDR family oxidoreductase [Calditrichota bacterium]
MNSKPHKHKAALITGASEGIGYELAGIMAADGWDLILTARREEILQDLAKDLREKHGIEVFVIPCDLSKPDATDDLFRKVHEFKPCVNALINNAGFGMIGYFKDADSDRINEMLNLNIISLVSLTRLFIPEMTRKGMGWIMNVGSVAGFVPAPYFATYSASKAFVNNFSDALACELDGTGITVTCLAPGPTRTGFGRVAGYKKAKREQPGALDAYPVAKLGYDGMLQGKRMVITGGFNQGLVRIIKLLPRQTVVNLTGSVMKKRIP